MAPVLPGTAIKKRSRFIRAVLINTMLFCLSLIFSLIFLEIAFLIYFFGPESLNPRMMNSTAALGVSGLVEPASNKETIYKLKPNLDTVFKMAKLTTNSAGLADKEYPMKKGTNIFRVAVIGDSHTMGTGVTPEQIYHSLLENRLSSESQDTSYEFINFGVRGYSLRQYVAVIEYETAKYSPDLLLIGFSTNDHIPVDEMHYQRRFLSRHREYPMFRFTAFANLRQIPEDSYAEDDKLEDHLAYVKQHFLRIAEISRFTGIPVVVVNLENRPSTPQRVALLKGLTEGYGLHFIDASANFPRRSRRRFQIYRRDGHPNDQIHALYADALYNDLSLLGLLHPP